MRLDMQLAVELVPNEALAVGAEDGLRRGILNKIGTRLKRAEE